MARPDQSYVKLMLTLPRFYAGKILFVDSTYGENISNQGYLPNRPLKSITYALAQCVDDNDDVILVMQGYDCDDTDTETNGDDTPIEVAKNGVTILSIGRNVIVSALAADDSIFQINANDVTIGALPGCQWTVQAAAAGTAATIVEIKAAAVRADISGFKTEDGADADGYDELITISATSHGAYIHDNHLVGNTTDTDEGILIQGTADGVRIENNTLIDCGASGGNIVSAAIHTNCVIKGNTVLERGTSKKGIAFTAACTGLLADNNVFVDTDANGIDPGSCSCFNNMNNDAIDQSGWIIPAIGSTT